MCDTLNGRAWMEKGIAGAARVNARAGMSELGLCGLPLDVVGSTFASLSLVVPCGHSLRQGVVGKLGVLAA